MSNSNILYKLDNGERRIKCESSVESGDYIFINSDGKAEKADASSIHKMPCIGRVVRVLPGNECVFKKDIIEPDYEDVKPRDIFFIAHDSPGELTDSAPTGKGAVIQHVGFGLANDEILVNIDPTNIIVRS